MVLNDHAECVHTCRVIAITYVYLAGILLGSLTIDKGLFIYYVIKGLLNRPKTPTLSYLVPSLSLYVVYVMVWLTPSDDNVIYEQPLSHP